MQYITRAIRILAVLFLANCAVLLQVLPLHGFAATAAVLTCLVIWLVIHFRPCSTHAPTRRLRALRRGYELLVTAFAVIVLSLVLQLVLWRMGVFAQTIDGVPMWASLVVSVLIAVPVIGILLLGGFFRVLITCNRLGIVWRVLLLTLWWMPLFNFYLFYRALKSAKSEYYFECGRLEQQAIHAENEDCKTRYPLVLVHGIFFRDWQHVNYWGRIPPALQACGATIYYGQQQSAAPVVRSAEELKTRIEQVLAETGADKVNIIAHSKGGLDSRYAISVLGLADRVASLTTISTPHRGCKFAEHLLDTLPKGVLGQMERKYNGLFRRLGDSDPDFLGGVKDLTASACAAFNRSVPDAPNVFYQSATSIMKSAGSAGFPLNLVWPLVKRYDKEDNDGLVAQSSAPWGVFLGVKTGAKKRGVSHGDTIDLMREDIEGFNVREFYIDIVRGLKEKGL